MPGFVMETGERGGSLPPIGAASKAAPAAAPAATPKPEPPPAEPSPPSKPPPVKASPRASAAKEAPASPQKSDAGSSAVPVLPVLPDPSPSPRAAVDVVEISVGPPEEAEIKLPSFKDVFLSGGSPAHSPRRLDEACSKIAQIRHEEEARVRAAPLHASPRARVVAWLLICARPGQKKRRHGRRGERARACGGGGRCTYDA
jgi:hypothetical protein